MLFRSIDKPDHKPTIHQTSTNTPQKELHRIDLQEDRGELCIEIKREREEAIQLITMDPRSVVNYSQLIREALVVMERPSMVDSPSGRAPMKAPRWDLADTEGCGGGIRFSWCSSMFSGYGSIYRRKK